MSAKKARFFTAKILRAEKESPTCKALYFQKPDGFAFLPGQFINLSIPLRRKITTRSYTISSAPEENLLRITFRLKGAFTRKLFNFKKGSTVRAIGPLGKFVFKRTRFIGKRAIFLAGGIGVAGFTSALSQIEKKGGLERSTLVYSERDGTDVPFKGELAKLKRTRVFITFTGTPQKGWDGPTGRIDKPLLDALLEKDDFSKGTFFVCGSDEFVSDMRKLLYRARVPKKNVLFEGFG